MTDAAPAFDIVRGGDAIRLDGALRIDDAPRIWRTLRLLTRDAGSGTLSRRDVDLAGATVVDGARLATRSVRTLTEGGPRIPMLTSILHDEGVVLSSGRFAAEGAASASDMGRVI